MIVMSRRMQLLIGGIECRCARNRRRRTFLPALTIAHARFLLRLSCWKRFVGRLLGMHGRGAAHAAVGVAEGRVTACREGQEMVIIVWRPRWGLFFEREIVDIRVNWRARNRAELVGIGYDGMEKRIKNKCEQTDNQESVTKISIRKNLELYAYRSLHSTPMMQKSHKETPELRKETPVVAL